ncbi:hypothetical protein D9756_002507 [Leucocoprinus leucothites]|uniref:Transmembrane protein n=1 Tax=Leucocoprinus leucothites TaxID=201217 RepID=A0A8H5LM23_9AGAR|nr:hypothetical protein D9756_002507 [Leucoagaricus leucothites]
MSESESLLGRNDHLYQTGTDNPVALTTEIDSTAPADLKLEWDSAVISKSETKRSYQSPTQSISDPSPRTSFAYLMEIPLLAFCLLEAAFVIFSWACFVHPITLPYVQYSNLSAVKSAFTAIFNTWHSIAVACGGSTYLESFSREWAARPEKTDAVSTICSGMIDRINHTFRGGATKTFRVAFAASLALFVLQTAGTSAIIVSAVAWPGLVHFFPPLHYLDLLYEATCLPLLELTMGVTAEFIPEKNWFIPLPKLNESSHEALSVTYGTDIVRFNYSCRWQALESVSDSGIVIGGKTWHAPAGVNPVLSGLVNLSTVIGLEPNGQDYGAGESAFLFLGGNSTLPATPPETITYANRWIDLGGLPTTDLRVLTSESFNAPLATLLICDPHLDFTSGTVRLSPTLSPSAPDIEVISQTSHVPIGNIDPATVRVLFAEGQVYTTGPYPVLLNPTIPNSLFFPSQFMEKEGPVAPLDSEKIAEQIGRGNLALMKRFTGGFTGAATDPLVGLKAQASTTTTVKGSYENSKLALVASAPFVIIHSILFVALVAVLLRLRFLNVMAGRPSFGLTNLEKALVGNSLLMQTSHSESPQPLARTVSHTSIASKANPDFSTLIDHHIDPPVEIVPNPPLDLDPSPAAASTSESDTLLSGFRNPISYLTKLTPLLTFHFITFFLLEAIFLALFWVCFAHPIPLPIVGSPDLSTAKSALTAFFAVWHTVAISCGGTICLQSFSREWAARQERTDIVSTITSGITDRFQYFIKPRATKTFQGALFIFLCLMVLRTTGTSTVITAASTRSASIAAVNLDAVPFRGSDFDAYNDTLEGGISNLQELTWFAFVDIAIEQFSGLKVGYRVEPNWVIPLPVRDFGSDATAVTYRTDLVHFQYSCQWRAPTFDNFSHVILDGGIWSSRGTSPPLEVQGSVISGFTPDGAATGESVFLFFGGNSTATSPPQWLELGNISASDRTMVPTINSTNAPARIASLLVCNPQFQFTSGEVLFIPTSNPSALEVMVQSHDLEAPPVGNINPDTIRSLFTWMVPHIGDNEDPFNVHSLSANLFVPEALDGKPGPVFPDLHVIEERLDNFTLSALKVFTYGYSQDPLSPVTGTSLTTSNTTPVNARVVSNQLALSASLPFATSHSVLFMITAIGLAILSALNHAHNRAPFDLVNVENILRGT